MYLLLDGCGTVLNRVGRLYLSTGKNNVIATKRSINCDRRTEELSELCRDFPIDVYLDNLGDNSRIINGLRLEASCDLQAGNVIGFSGKYCLSTDGRQNDTLASFIWSDFTGNNGDNQHQDADHDDFDTRSSDWFNGWGIRGIGGDYRRVLTAE